MAKSSSSKRSGSSRRARKLSKGGAINRASVRGTARGGDRKMQSPNARRTSSTRTSGSGRKGREDTPTRGLDPQRTSTRPNRQNFGTVDSAQRAPANSREEPNRARAQATHRKSGANGGSRFEYDERDSTDSAEPTGWSGMDEERQKRPSSRETKSGDRDWSRTNAGEIDNDYEETLSRPERTAASGRRSARADAGDHATPARGETADTEAHVTGAAARGRRGNGRVGETAGRGRAGRPRNDW